MEPGEEEEELWEANSGSQTRDKGTGTILYYAKSCAVAEDLDVCDHGQ